MLTMYNRLCKVSISNRIGIFPILPHLSWVSTVTLVAFFVLCVHMTPKTSTCTHSPYHLTEVTEAATILCSQSRSGVITGKIPVLMFFLKLLIYHSVQTCLVYGATHYVYLYRHKYVIIVFYTE